MSLGAFCGPIPVALEQANFSPHVQVPVQVVNGSDDFGVPVAAQDRFFELLGTPPKRHAVLEGGHGTTSISGA